jgi:uncharacterized protein YfiM (DUF2279 family)
MGNSKVKAWNRLIMRSAAGGAISITPDGAKSRRLAGRMGTKCRLADRDFAARA